MSPASGDVQIWRPEGHLKPGCLDTGDLVRVSLGNRQHQPLRPWGDKTASGP